MPVIDPGDDSVVLHLRIRLLPRHESAFGYEGAGDVAQLVRDRDGAWHLLLSLDRAGARRRYALQVRPDGSARRLDNGKFAWAISRGDAATLKVEPSVSIPGDLHAIVTVTDAAQALPWEGGPGE